MKYKEGDKVKVIKTNSDTVEVLAMVGLVGEIKYVSDGLFDAKPYGVYNEAKTDFWWFKEDELESVEEAPKNLIPEIAKMLGVEVGEEFKVSHRENELYKFTSDYLMKNEVGRTSWSEEWYMLGKLLNGFHEIQKLPPKPKLTEAERVILENLPKEYKWIARDEDNKIWVFELKPDKECDYWTFKKASSMFDRIVFFEHLFQFIKWEDSEAYKIQELLEEYENLRSE